jgi:Mn2+/Fe2+ NRAMP family transporter
VVRKRLLNILFWSVISAAFIGPGTVTTAAKAGADHEFTLLWALLFSTLACLLLQEASARIAIYSGKNLGEAISSQFDRKSSRITILVLIIGAIILGSAAYETGNLLGAIAGIQTIWPVSNYILVIMIGIAAAIVLSIPSLRIVSRMMGYLVVIMGFAFLITAILLKPQIFEVLKGTFVPSLPGHSGAGLLVLGLIGTTVVPYNLFLGSGLTDKKQDIKEMRFGLTVAILFGGLISMAVLIVGTAVTGEFSYENLVTALSGKIGNWAIYIFGLGMFAAGFTSAVTAPLASAVTAKSLFAKPDDRFWETSGFRYRLVWIFVLLTGIAFGMADVKPIPAIIMAQALNGLILPVVSIFLLFVVNDMKLMGQQGRNGAVLNLLMGFVVLVTLIIGFTNIMKAIISITGDEWISHENSLILISIISLLISILIFIRVYKLRMSDSDN